MCELHSNMLRSIFAFELSHLAQSLWASSESPGQCLALLEWKFLLFFKNKNKKTPHKQTKRNKQPTHQKNTKNTLPFSILLLPTSKFHSLVSYTIYSFSFPSHGLSHGLSMSFLYLAVGGIGRLIKWWVKGNNHFPPSPSHAPINAAQDAADFFAARAHCRFVAPLPPQSSTHKTGWNILD